jgi:serine protease Do
MKIRLGQVVLALSLLAILLSPLPWSLAAHARPGSDSVQTHAPALEPLTYDPSVSLAPLVERLGPAVVNIDISKQVDLGPLGNWMFDLEGESPVQMGQGSGFVISEDGYILTNHHVIAGADKVDIRLADHRVFEAEVIGTDPRTDVALVKIDSKESLPHVSLGSSHDARVGDWVVAIGNPFGLDHTVTAGIISAKGRILGAGPYDDFIQTDASINPGNSGGPLFNLQGEVVGINTAVSRRGSGIGFAVPIDMVKEILEDLKTTGLVSRGWMGVGLQDLNPSLAQKLGLTLQEGVLLSAVYPETPAHQAGLKVGDVLLTMDGKEILSSDALVRAVGKKRAGETITLAIRRGERDKRLTVTLASRPDEQALRRPAEQPPEPDADRGRIGIVIKELDSSQPGVEAGVLITRVESESPADGRLRPGDVILRINEEEIRTVTDVQRALDRDENLLLFVVHRSGGEELITVPLR